MKDVEQSPHGLHARLTKFTRVSSSRMPAGGWTVSSNALFQRLGYSLRERWSFRGLGSNKAGTPRPGYMSSSSMQMQICTDPLQQRHVRVRNDDGQLQA